jgi:hypothetical protein
MRRSIQARFVPPPVQNKSLSMPAPNAHGRSLEVRSLQCPNCSQPMTLQGGKSETTKPSSTIFECKPCKLSIAEAIQDDLSK